MNEEKYLNKIICANSIEIMKELPDKSIDLCLTDFPYGIEIKYDVFEDTQKNLIKLINEAMPEILRISKVALMTVGEKNIFSYPKPDHILHWVNQAGTGLSNWGFICSHSILAYGKDPHKGRRPDTILLNNSLYEDVKKYKKFHPCPKPEKIWSWLLLRGSKNENDIVLDPFCGSGTTCAVAKKLGRKYIGIDISEEYCNIAKKRLNETKDTRTRSLFDFEEVKK